MSRRVVTLLFMQPAKLLERIRRGEVTNVDFADLVSPVLALGFPGGRGAAGAIESSPETVSPSW